MFSIIANPFSVPYKLIRTPDKDQKALVMAGNDPDFNDM